MEPTKSKLEEELKTLREEQEKQAKTVRELKKNNAKKEEIEKEVQKLTQLKTQVEAKNKELNPPKVEFPRADFEQLLKQRFFVIPSFEIYGGIAGLYDLGPPGTAIKANLLNLWRNHFVITENMLEVDCSCVTPEPVLVTSGHVAKFADLMVKDVEKGGCYRADHLLKNFLEKLLENKDLSKELRDEYENVIAVCDTYSKEEMGRVLKKYKVKSPDTGNDLTDPEPFNLMFQTSIGPTGQVKGYLRPETAQGIFVNFKRLLEYNGGKLPFAAAQIGQAFRNEIAPRSGLLRVREFTLAEIEHFVNVGDKSHPKFADISKLVLTLFPREQQVTTLKPVEMSLAEAVSKGIIANETLGYFIGRVYLFLLAAGIKRERLRFRQHLKDEMAHYACDCWDAEINNSYGWVESVGIADRSAYDLTAHSSETKTPLSAFLEYKTGAKEVEVLQIKVDKSKVGKAFKGDAQSIIKELSEMEEHNLASLQTALAKGPASISVGGKSFEVSNDFISFEKVKKRITGEHITPGVIEPSFGIGRILYSILEHAYYTREGDTQRSVLSLPPIIAPVKISILPLVNAPELLAFIPKLATLFTSLGISFKVDDVGHAIGRRYARTDEIGIPFGATIDHQTTTDSTVTLRERDTMTQVRIPISELGTTIQGVLLNNITWKDIQSKYPSVVQPEEK